VTYQRFLPFYGRCYQLVSPFILHSILFFVTLMKAALLLYQLWHNFVTNTYFSSAVLPFEYWEFVVKASRVGNHENYLSSSAYSRIIDVLFFEHVFWCGVTLMWTHILVWIFCTLFFYFIMELYVILVELCFAYMIFFEFSLWIMSYLEFILYACIHVRYHCLEVASHCVMQHC
jgi:hypothetical protein